MNSQYHMGNIFKMWDQMKTKSLHSLCILNVNIKVIYLTNSFLLIMLHNFDFIINSNFMNFGSNFDS
jgi:hypothetical protein